MLTQPLGYNFLGGKLVSKRLLVQRLEISGKKIIIKHWAESQRLQFFMVFTHNTMEYHIGKLLEKLQRTNQSKKPDDSIYLVWNQWLKENHYEEHHKASNLNEPKKQCNQ